MLLVIISGRSGSGKSTALHLLEDEGFYCIDNMPASLLPALIKELATSDGGSLQRVAVCIDARNTRKGLQDFDEISRATEQHAKLQVVYLDAASRVLIKRFSETRRKHPLSGSRTALGEAIEAERNLLEPIAKRADLQVDTSAMNVHELRSYLRSRITQSGEDSFSVLIESFGFKGGIPIDADIVYDLRMLPNPHWQDQLRQLTGRDEPVQTFLEAAPEVQEMFDDIHSFLQRWLPRMQASGRSYVTVAVGCTGGQHRSVYMAERLLAALQAGYQSIQIRHRELLESGSPNAATVGADS